MSLRSSERRRAARASTMVESTGGEAFAIQARWRLASQRRKRTSGRSGGWSSHLLQAVICSAEFSIAVTKVRFYSGRSCSVSGSEPG